MREGRPFVWAHRGACARAPENTVPAFELARRLGADGVECDVMLCATGELVVCHDHRLARLCGVPDRVAALPASALARLRVLAHRFPAAGAGIPTLAEAVEAAGPELCWNVELKVDGHDEAVPLGRAAAVQLRRLPLAGRVLVSSFHPLALLALLAAAPELPTAFLWDPDEGRAHGLFGLLTATRAVHPERRAVDVRLVERWHRRGRLVNAWTADDPAELVRLREAGVDGVFTNVPDVARATYGGP